MASALIGGLLRSGWSKNDLTVVERDRDQRRRLAEAFGVATLTSPEEVSSGPEVVVWAVKPQVLREVAVQCARRLPGALHLSIAAGIETGDLCTWLGTQRVVRAMPNTAAMVSSGVTGLCAAPGATDSDRRLAERIMQATGITFWVDSDERMNAVTAVSGSGPAYAFYFMEGLQKAAASLGFDDAMARELALRVVEGAVRQALATNDTLATLSERVTSKGGTTAAALEVFNRRDVHGTTLEALQAAYQRAGDLARTFALGGASQP